MLQFTITRYTNQHPSIPGGLLCGPCDKEIGPGMSGGGAGKSSASAVPSAAKKKARAVKGKTVLNKDKPQVTSLTKSCIELIGKAIDHVEELGDIGEWPAVPCRDLRLSAGSSVGWRVKSVGGSTRAPPASQNPDSCYPPVYCHLLYDGNCSPGKQAKRTSTGSAKSCARTEI